MAHAVGGVFEALLCCVVGGVVLMLMWIADGISGAR